MSVSLVLTDVKQPTGEIDASLFPDGDADTFLASWLEQAVTKVEASTGIATEDQDEAAAAWVYYRAYKWVADRIANTAESITVGPRTERTSATQQKYFADLANYWLEQFYGFNTVSPVAGIPAFFSTVKARRNCVTRY